LLVGAVSGAEDRVAVGWAVGAAVGANEGDRLGVTLGSNDGAMEIVDVGKRVVELDVDPAVGTGDGNGVG
jgi:hypothetical protein